MKSVINLQSEVDSSDGEGLSILICQGIRINLKTGVTKECISAEVRRHNATKSGRRNIGEVVMRLIADDDEGYPELLEQIAERWRQGDVPVS